jgi:hypothetical protein
VGLSDSRYNPLNDEIHRFSLEACRREMGEAKKQPRNKSPSSVDALSEKLDLIIKRLDALESLILERPEYEGLLASLRLTKVGLGLYDEPLKIASRLKAAEHIIIKKPEVGRDEMSRCIVQALAVKGPLNISAITRQVQAMRGTASRRIIRQRLRQLEQEGTVCQAEGFGKKYKLAEQ